jgi:hypothetical protein
MWLIHALLALAIGLMWASRQREMTALRADLKHANEMRRPHAGAQKTNLERTDEVVSAGVEGQAALEADQTAIARLRAEIQQMKMRALARTRQPRPASNESITLPKTILNEMVPADGWRNAGQATPAATLETALWAAAAGDVESLAGLLAIDPVARVHLNGLLMRLPESLRHEYDTPERLMALLTARDVPSDGAAQIRDAHLSATGGTEVVAVLRDASQKQRLATLTLRQEGPDWKLIVPAAVVDRYAGMLEKPGALR